MKRAYIFNTGCIRRALDSTRVYNYLAQNGWVFTNNLSRADVVIVSTCGAVKDDEDLSLNALRYVAKRKCSGTKVIVTGCLPKLNPEKISEIPGAGDFEFVPTRDLDGFDSLLGAEVKFEDVPEANLVTNEQGLFDYVLGYRLFRHSVFQKLYTRLSVNRRFVRSVVCLSESVNSIRSKLHLAARNKVVPYYNLRIAEGCVFACSFCCIRFATGKLRSKPIEQIVREFKTGLKGGHRLFQLVCEDVGCYGLDIGTTFPALLRELLKVEGDYQLLLIDFGGYWLVKYYDELLPLFMGNPNRIRELYVSLQSGSDKILKAMNRPEKGGEVRAKLKELKKRLPHLTLRTTVIVGFPGETETDFQETIEAIREVDFSVVELNKYSDRPGTASSLMKDKVPQHIIDARTEEISQYC
jgi:tRNA A37 methylthiotransferase MiaB